MSQVQYNGLSQGPATIPIPDYANQQPRITPQPVAWCNSRRTKVIIAIVILTVLWLITVIVWAVAKKKVVQQYEDDIRRRYDR